MKVTQLLLLFLLCGGGVYGQYLLEVTEDVDECRIVLIIKTIEILSNGEVGGNVILPPNHTSDDHSTIKYFIEWGDGQSDYIQVDTSGITTFSHGYIYAPESDLVVKANYIYSDGDEPDSYRRSDDSGLIPLVEVFGICNNRNDIPDGYGGVYGDKTDRIISNPSISFRFEDSPSIGRKSTGIIEYWRGEMSETNGKIKFYYNEIDDEAMGFEYYAQSGEELNKGTRHCSDDYFIENRSTNPNDLQAGFTNVMVWSFSELDSGELRTIFFDLYTSEDLEIDISRTVNFAIELDFADDTDDVIITTASPEVYSALDPNLMIPDKREIPWEDQIIEYKVQFQNIGAAKVRNVYVDLNLPPELDVTSIKVKDFSPKGYNNTKFTRSGSQITLYNLYLPGSNQSIPGGNGALYPYEKSIGYVTFEVAHKARVERDNYQLLSSADVTFDDLEVIQTKTATIDVVVQEATVTLTIKSIIIIVIIIILILIILFFICRWKYRKWYKKQH